MKRQWVIICVIALMAVVSQTVFAAGAIEIPAFKEWTFADGVWEVADNGLLHVSTEGANTNAYVALPQKGNKLVYEWTIMYLESGSSNAPMAGMHILSDDVNADAQRGHSYLIWQDKKNVTVYRSILNSLRTLAKFSAPAAAGDTFTYRTELDIANQTINVYRNGELIGSINDPEMYVAGEYISARTNVTVALFSDLKISVE